MKHTLRGKIETGEVWLDGEALSPTESQRVVNHSPDGFCWGYGGSGPSQLALAIILKLTGQPAGYQEFKWKVIAKLPQADFESEFEYPEVK